MDIEVNHLKHFSMLMKHSFSTNVNANGVSVWLLIARIVIGGLLLTHGVPKLQQLMSGNVQFPDPFHIGATASLALTVFAAGTMLTSCSTPAEKVDAAKAEMEASEKAMEQAKENYNVEYSKFKEESDRQITSNEERIAELKEESKKMKADTKVKFKIHNAYWKRASY